MKQRMPRPLLALATLLCACGPQELRIHMKSDNNSGQTGFAVMSLKSADKFDLVIETSVPIDGTGKQRAHIHTGTCGEVGPIVVGLQLLDQRPDGGWGSTSTDLPMEPLKDFENGGYLVNVHDATENSLYVSCGEIPKP